MNENKINCEHYCKNTCATLEEAIKRHEGLVQLYESALIECSIPDISSLLNRMIINAKKVIDELKLKLSEIKSTSGIIDDIEKSYDSDEM
jgi:hypothetical protein